MPAEFFDTAEIALNKDGQSWGNLGLWRDGDHYSDACRELALALGRAADLKEGSHVFDAGFGCGDQLLLWLEHFHVASLQGLNLSTSQTQQAKALLEQHGHAHHGQQLVKGDIDDFGLWPRAGAPAPDRILCLDSAYHFPRRDAFLEHAGRALPSGGRLCLTDFVLGETVLGGARELVQDAMLQASRLPRENLVSTTEYHAVLEQAGFDDIELKDISRAVMRGFAAWWASYRSKAAQLPIRSRLKYAVTASFLDWTYRKGALRYLLISARRS